MATLLQRCFSVCLLLACCALPHAGAAALPADVVGALKRAGIPLQAVGIVVQDVASRKARFAVNPKAAFSPASTMKLVTTDAALEQLGPAFTWKTRVYMRGKLAGGVLQGDLVFKGGGDPSLVTEKCWALLRQIRAAGIREIRGNVILDRSAFAPLAIDPAQFDGDPGKPYNAAPDALLLNFHVLRFQFMPDPDHAQVTVALDPPLAGYGIVPPQAADDACGDWQARLDAQVGETDARFAGVYAAACGQKVWYVHPFRMDGNRYFSAVFKQMWMDAGGSFSGQVVDGSVDPDAQLVTVWESVALPEVIRDINKFSNNVMARQLLLTLAMHADDAPANPERGAQAVVAWLHGKGIDAPELSIDNGSGLSRDERIAPASMTRLLIAAYQSALMPEFIASLPLAGYDGTMRHRLNDEAVAGNAHIKTGSLKDVKAACGYVRSASGKLYAVTFFINHPNAARGEEAQDALLQWIYVHG